MSWHRGWSAIVCDRVLLHSGAQIRALPATAGSQARRRALKGDNAELQGRGRTGMNQWEELQRAATNGRVSRREFMRRAAALGVATSLASGVLAKAGYAQTPVKGGNLRVGIAGRQHDRQHGHHDLYRHHDDQHLHQRLRRPGRGRRQEPDPARTARDAGAQRRCAPNGCATSARASPSATARRWTPTTSSIRSTCIAAKARSRARPAR